MKILNTVSIISESCITQMKKMYTEAVRVKKMYMYLEKSQTLSLFTNTDIILCRKEINNAIFVIICTDNVRFKQKFNISIFYFFEKN